MLAHYSLTSNFLLLPIAVCNFPIPIPKLDCFGSLVFNLYLVGKYIMLVFR